MWREPSLWPVGMSLSMGLAPASLVHTTRPPARPALPCRSLLTAFERDGEAGKILGLLKQLGDSGDVNQVRWC